MLTSLGDPMQEHEADTLCRLLFLEGGEKGTAAGTFVITFAGGGDGPCNRECRGFLFEGWVSLTDSCETWGRRCPKHKFEVFDIGCMTVVSRQTETFESILCVITRADTQNVWSNVYVLHRWTIL